MTRARMCFYGESDLDLLRQNGAQVVDKTDAYAEIEVDNLAMLLMNLHARFRYACDHVAYSAIVDGRLLHFYVDLDDPEGEFLLSAWECPLCGGALYEFGRLNQYGTFSLASTRGSHTHACPLATLAS